MIVDKLKRKARGARSRFFRLFQPGETALRHVRYLGAEFLVFANEDVGWRLITRGTYERDEIECLESFIREDDLCVDIGGNIGIYSVFMGRKARKGRVVVFEPVRVNRCTIDFNAALNGLDNVEVMDKAVSDAPGTTTFSISADSAYSSLRQTDRSGEERSIEVGLTTLDESFEKGGLKVGVLKIDIEGAELPALKGGSRLLSDERLRPRAVMVEICGDNEAPYGYGPEDIVSFMDSVGYRPYSVKCGRLVEGWSQTRRTENVFFLPDGTGPDGR